MSVVIGLRPQMDHSWHKRYHALRWKSVTYFTERAGRPECLLLEATRTRNSR